MPQSANAILRRRCSRMLQWLRRAAAAQTNATIDECYSNMLERHHQYRVASTSPSSLHPATIPPCTLPAAIYHHFYTHPTPHIHPHPSTRPHIHTLHPPTHPPIHPHIHTSTHPHPHIHPHFNLHSNRSSVPGLPLPQPLPAGPCQQRIAPSANQHTHASPPLSANDISSLFASNPPPHHRLKGVVAASGRGAFVS